MKKAFIALATLCFLSLNLNAKLYPFLRGEKTGYVSETGEAVVEPKYDTDYKIYYVEIGKNKKLERVVYPPYAQFSEGLATVKISRWFWFINLGNSYAVIDEDGDIVVPEQEGKIYSFKYGLAVVQIPLKTFQYVYDEVYSFIDRDGKRMTDSVYEWVSQFQGRFAVAMKNGKYGYIDRSWRFVIPPRFDDARNFSPSTDLAAVRLGDKWTYVNPSGEIAFESKFDKAWDFVEGFARVYSNGKYHFINTSGLPTFNSREYDFADDFSEGLARVLVNGKYGFIFTDERFAVEPKFEDAGNFSEGMAPAKLEGKWGYIGSRGNFLIEPRFDFALPFDGALAIAWIDGQAYYINKNGEKVFKYYEKKRGLFEKIRDFFSF